LEQWRKQLSANSKASKDNYVQAENKLFVKVWKRIDFTDFFGSRQLIIIEEMGCPSLNRFKGNRFTYCETHLKGGDCALNNAYII